MIKYRELVKKTMPESKRKSASKDILGFYLLRPIENLICIPLISAGVPATSITVFSFYVAIFAFVAFLIPGSIGFWIGWILLLIWNICDGLDGNIARYTNTCSSRGDLWDATAGWVAIISFYFGMGMEAFYRAGYVFISLEPYYYIIMGCLTGLFWIFPRTVMHKKATIEGIDSVKDVKGRSDYGVFKLIAFNFTSITGLGSLLFLISYLLNLSALCMTFYFLLSAAVCMGSLYSLLRKEKK